MRLHTFLALGLATLLAMALTAPVLAQGGRDDGKGNDRSLRGRITARINVHTQDTPDETRAFDSWYEGQVRGYGSIDTDTGERLNSLIHIVQEVRGNQLIVSSRYHHRAMIQLNSRTKVIFQEITPSWTPPGFNRGRRPQGGTFVANRIRPGDLVILEGVLTNRGDLLATRIRVIGHAWGWSDDDDDDYYRPTGYRAWGEVRLVDSRRNSVEVRANTGYVTLTLSRNGKVLYKGREYRIANLEKGDRVVFYYERNQDNRDRSIEAYLIVALEGNHSYPRGDERYWADPSGYDRGDDRDQYQNAGDWIDGNLDYIDIGVTFNKLVLRVQRGKPGVFYLPKSLLVIDEDGSRISVQSLRDGEQLRVYYMEMDGHYHATRIVAR
jgi:hypothetical protein